MDEESVDVIVSNELVCGLPRKEQLGKALREFRKNLRAGRMKAESIHHLDLRVTNYRKSLSFLNGILRPLGFRTIGVRGEVVTYYLKGPTCLGIRPVKKSSQRDISYSYKKAGIHHFAI